MGALLERLKRFLERYLRPEDSLLEVVGGVIVVLATANTMVVARDRAGVEQVLGASFAVAIAWGLVDGGLGLLGTVYHRNYQARIVRDAGHADEMEGAAILANALDDELLELAEPDQLDAFVHHLTRQARTAPDAGFPLRRNDLIVAALTAALMFAAMLPLTIPLYLIDDPDTGVLAMNAMAFVFLFGIGYLWGAYTTMRRVRFGLSLGSVALALTAVTMIFS